MARKDVLRRFGIVATAAMTLIAGGIGVARAELKNLTLKDVETRILTAYDALQNSCSGGVETAAMIDMDTGEWTNIATRATHAVVGNDSDIISQWGQDPERDNVRFCHCHIDEGDPSATLAQYTMPAERFSVDPMHGNEGANSVNAQSLRSLTSEFNAHTVSGLDVMAGVGKLGIFFSERPRAAEASIDFCIIPTEKRKRFPISQEIIVYRLQPTLEETTRGIVRGLLGSDGEPVEEILEGSLSELPEMNPYSNLHTYAHTKGSEHSTARSAERNRFLGKTGRDSAVARLKDASADIIYVEHMQVDRELGKEYRATVNDGFYPTLTNDRPHIWKPCDPSEPAVYSGLSPDQLDWLKQGLDPVAFADVDLDGDGLDDRIAVQVVSDALRSCGFSEDWVGKQTFWGIGYGNGEVVRGKFNAPFMFEDLRRTMDGSGALVFLGKDFDGNQSGVILHPRAGTVEPIYN